MAPTIEHHGGHSRTPEKPEVRPGAREESAVIYVIYVYKIDEGIYLEKFKIISIKPINYGVLATGFLRFDLFFSSNIVFLLWKSKKILLYLNIFQS